MIKMSCIFTYQHTSYTYGMLQSNLNMGIHTMSPVATVHDLLLESGI